MLDTLVHTLTEDLQLEELPKKDKESSYTLALNPELKIQIAELDPGIAFFAQLGECPQNKKEELFIYLMKANFLGQGTGGSSIGFNESENLLTLSLVLPYDMNYKAFRNALEDFVNYLDYWKEEIIKHKETSSVL